MYGMNKSLQEHMLAGTRRGAGSQNPRTLGGQAGSSINSFASERQDIIAGGAAGRFALPKINVGGARRVGAGLQSPFGEGLNQSLQGKMTPMYENKKYGLGSSGKGKAGGNIFA